jgi:hypothetical protein
MCPMQQISYIVLRMINGAKVKIVVGHANDNLKPGQH